MTPAESQQAQGPETVPAHAPASASLKGVNSLPPRPQLSALERVGCELLRWGLWPSTLVGALSIGVLSAGLAALIQQIFAAPSAAALPDAGSGPALGPMLWTVGWVAFVLTAFGLSAWLKMVQALQASREREDALSWVDDMTGVHNRRTFMEAADGEWARARRYGTQAALLLVDADHFMALNDRHGHLCGDELLRQIASAVQASLRQADLLGRFGGAQFAVFLPHTEVLGALDVAERIRNQVQSIKLGWLANVVSTTVSVGVAPLRPELPTLDWMVHEAETALMAAKAEGRNRVRALAFDEGQFDENQRQSTR